MGRKPLTWRSEGHARPWVGVLVGYVSWGIAPLRTILQFESLQYALPGGEGRAWPVHYTGSDSGGPTERTCYRKSETSFSGFDLQNLPKAMFTSATSLPSPAANAFK